jgi:hypothetical protein
MATTPGPRILLPQDTVYRVIEPRFWDAEGIKADAFEDPHLASPETLSFFVKGYATPRVALGVIGNRKQARIDCGTRNRKPSPEQLCQARYRIAELSASILLEAVRSPDNRLSIEMVGVVISAIEDT